MLDACALDRVENRMDGGRPGVQGDVDSHPPEEGEVVRPVHPRDDLRDLHLPGQQRAEEVLLVLARHRHEHVRPVDQLRLEEAEVRAVPVEDHRVLETLRESETAFALGLDDAHPEILLVVQDPRECLPHGSAADDRDVADPLRLLTGNPLLQPVEGAALAHEYHPVAGEESGFAGRDLQGVITDHRHREDSLRDPDLRQGQAHHVGLLGDPVLHEPDPAPGEDLHIDRARHEHEPGDLVREHPLGPDDPVDFQHDLGPVEGGQGPEVLALRDEAEGPASGQPLRGERTQDVDFIGGAARDEQGLFVELRPPERIRMGGVAVDDLHVEPLEPAGFVRVVPDDDDVVLLVETMGEFVRRLTVPGDRDFHGERIVSALPFPVQTSPERVESRLGPRR